MRPALIAASIPGAILLGVDFYQGDPYYEISFPGGHTLKAADGPDMEKVGAEAANSRYDGRPPNTAPHFFLQI